MKNFKIINGVGFIPEGTTKIEDNTFEDCKDLVSITIPDSVTEIGEQAFAECTNLKDVTIGKSVTSIGNFAFRDCTSLKSIDLLHRLVSIDDDIFEGCTSLESINVPANTTIYYKIFLSEDVYDFIVEIPTKKLSAVDEYRVKTQLKFMTISPRQAYLMAQFYSEVLERISIETLTPREIQIINDITHGRPLKEICAELHISSLRARQIYSKALHKMPNWRKMIEERDAEIKRLKQEILRLKNPDLYAKPLAESELLSKPIAECDFSERTLTCLEAAEIKTVADLVKFHRADLLKFRDFGKKNLTELDEWLEAHGLSFGMEI